MILMKKFLLFGLSFSHSKIFSFFILKSDSHVALTKNLNLNLKIHFPAIYSMQKTSGHFDFFCLSDPTMMNIDKTKTSDILCEFFTMQL